MWGALLTIIQLFATINLEPLVSLSGTLSILSVESLSKILEFVPFLFQKVNYDVKRSQTC